MRTPLFSCPQQHACPARRPTQRGRAGRFLFMQAGKGGDAQEGPAGEVPLGADAQGTPTQTELSAGEDAVPWQPGGDQIYAVLEVAPPPVLLLYSRYRT